MKEKFLIIQTAFTGDVILATAVVEKLKSKFPDATIDFLLRAGNESVLYNNPHLRQVLIWDKKENKISNLFRLLAGIREEKYDTVIDLHRFASSGFLTAFSGAKNKTGFDKNPFSFFFNKKVKHEIGNGKHETERNQELIVELTDSIPSRPRLYPSDADFNAVRRFKNDKYICIAPGSVWFTKTFPESRWTEFILLYTQRKPGIVIYLLGSEGESMTCERILHACSGAKVVNLAGQLSFLESAALMKDAIGNYVNDSAPLHIASAMNARVTAVYCSTVPAFGFGPLSDVSVIVETSEKLDCRPCGLHGFAACPKKHFRCATTIDINQMLQ